MFQQKEQSKLAALKLTLKTMAPIDSTLRLYFLRDMRTDLFSNGEIISHAWVTKGKGWISLGALSTYIKLLVAKQTDTSFMTWEIVEYRIKGIEVELQSRFPASALLHNEEQ